MTPADRRPVVLFDGVCNLCDRFVLFVIDRDTHAEFAFASLQSEVAQRLLHGHKIPEDLSTVVLVETGQVSVRSTAAIRIVAKLGMPWALCRTLLLIPRPIRDLVYDWVARNRHALFGTRESCRVPTADLRARFLDQG
ncbi:MAG: DCC1-like thiol-disulfide oxidoreductase family protein [Vicinamibacterales bacterium]